MDSNAAKSTAPPSERSRLSLVVRLLIGAALLVIVFRSVDLGAVGSTLASLDPLWAVAFVLTAWFDRVLMAYKWNLLLRAQGIRISHWQAFRLFMVGALLGFITPGAIGADAYRVTALAPLRKTSVVIATVVLERFIGLAVIGSVAALALPFSARYLGVGSRSVVFVIIVATVLAVLGVVVSLRPAFVEAAARRVPYLSKLKVAKKLGKYYRAYADFGRHSGTLLAFTLLTLLEVLVLVLLNYVGALSLGIDATFWYMLTIIPLLHILIRLPITFQGIGVFEGLFAYFLQAAGFSAAAGVSLALLFRAADVGLILLPAAVLLWTNPVRIQPSASTS